MEGPSGAQIGGNVPRVSPAQSAGEVCPALGPCPMHSESPSGLRWSWGNRMEAGGRTREAGGRGPPGPKEQERHRGHLLCLLEPGKPARLPGGVPCSLTRSGRHTWAPSVPLSLSPTPPYLPGPFPALWVLSIGPTHCPNPTLAYDLPSTAKAFSTFLGFFSSSFLLLWFCFPFWLLFHLYFYFIFFLTYLLVS